MDLIDEVRRRARRDRRSFIDDGCPPHGADFLAAIAKRFDVVVVHVARGDVLLQGARAKLELDSGMRLLYVDSSLDLARQTFCTAHELAHLFLHGGDDLCGGPELEDEEGASQSGHEHTVEVYNPRQQREREANAYALALLAPSDEVLAAYLREPDASSDDVVRTFGISRQTALGQLIDGLAARSSGDHDESAPYRPMRSIPAAGRDDDGVEIAPTLQLEESTPAGSAFSASDVAEDVLVSLDEEQRAAVSVDPGPVFVEAGPGSGKTRTLVARVVWLIRERRVAPDRILVLTFSNDATNELRARVARALGRRATAVTVATFHAFSLDLLRRYGGAIGLRPDVGVIDGMEARLLVRAHLGELPLHHFARAGNPSWFVPDLLRAIGRAKDSLVGPATYAAAARAALGAAGDDESARLAERSAEVAACYESYQGLLASHGVVDFGDLLASAVDLLRRDAAVLEEVRARYPHVLVDEYQDVNPACDALVEQLAGDGAGLWVVGDPRQAIYAFRGATPSILDRFRRRHPDAAYVALARNYRSTAALVSLFEAVARDGERPARAQEDGSSADQARRDVVWAVAADERAELLGLVHRIEELAARGVAPSDQAVLCRTNGRARSVARALEEAGIDAVAASGAFDRPEVKDLLAVLSTLGDADGMGLVRLGERPEHPFAADAAAVAIARAVESGSGVLDLVGSDALPDGVSPADRDGLRRLAATLGGLETLPTWEALATYLFDRTPLGRRLATAGGRDASSARLAVAALLRMARGFDAARWARFQGTTYASAHPAFLDHVRFLIEESADDVAAPRGDAGPAGVRVLTAHASKGLEFAAVHVPFLARGVWPPRHGPEHCPAPPGLLDDPAAPAPDDAELFYVAITRARRHLTLSRADRYGGRGARPSPYWELAEPHVAGLAGEADRWDGARDATTTPAPQHDEAGAIEADIRSLETYIACPRRYYYQHVLGLKRRGGDQAGFAFRRCVSDVARRLAELRADGRLPGPGGEIETLLREAWTTHGLCDQPYEPIYWREASAMVERCRRSLARNAPAIGVDSAVTVPLSNVRVSLEIDRVDALPGGEIALVRYRNGKPAPDHAREPRIALYQMAATGLARARGQPCRVAIEYLSTGERVDIPGAPNPRPTRGRARSGPEDLESAAAGMASRRFEPRVGEPCRTCSFNLICPRR